MGKADKYTKDHEREAIQPKHFHVRKFHSYWPLPPARSSDKSHKRKNSQQKSWTEDFPANINEE